ncbi:uncharacterized protein LOC111598348 [Drosophila hydei]|uniref:Uncharacterized protein LOC111598348 n=1 Tax=Drosophila hydei TaxID=7224 RepID=A0A6J1LSI6_DROHY|nr:uncharacterized protein LOC111598348 [Drosophila hydei]
MSFFKNMLNGNVKRSPIPDEKTKEKEIDMPTTDIFEGGHKLTALENIGSSLTTLWSSCGLNVVSSSNDSLSSEPEQKNIPNTSNEIASANAEDTTLRSSY